MTTTRGANSAGLSRRFIPNNDAGGLDEVGSLNRSRLRLTPKAGADGVRPKVYGKPPFPLGDKSVHVLLVHGFRDEGHDDQDHEIQDEALNARMDIPELGNDLQNDQVVVNDTG